MQLLGAFHKRKSIQKIEPQMPKIKLSKNSRQNSRKKHRTQHNGIESPQLQLKNYKRKNFKILNELQTSDKSQSVCNKQLTLTDRTQQTKILTEQSIQQKINRKKQNYSINSSKNQQDELNSQQSKIKRQEITSRFTQNHHDTQSSLTFLINQTKSENSNPLINTARIKQEYQKNASKIQNTNITPFNLYGQKNQLNPKHSLQRKTPIIQKSLSQENLQMLRQTQKQNDEEINEQNQNQQNDQNEQNQDQVQNFDDYQFGGKNSGSVISQEVEMVGDKKKKKGKKIMPPPKVQSYASDVIIKEKPQNWRQLNRYVPTTQEQHRMAQQHYIKQRKNIQLKRQQQQIITMIQQYQISKNAVAMTSKRKIQSNKIIQTIYKNKRLNQLKQKSLSLPQLKTFTQAKRIINLDQANQHNHQQIQNNNKYKVKNILAKSFEPQNRQQQNRYLKHSLSYNRMGFGCRQSRNLYQDEIKQSEMENIEIIQKKLRSKGVQFNPESIRKGILNFRDSLPYKFSGKKTKQKNSQSINLSQNKMQVPQKQLPSNGFYKIFPL